MANRFLQTYFGIVPEKNYSLTFDGDTEIYGGFGKKIHDIKAGEVVFLPKGNREEIMNIILSDGEQISVPGRVNATYVGQSLHKEGVSEVTDDYIQAVRSQFELLV